ncbi:hypothetical protein V2J09_004391, partial [Rumex salicifolius]
TTSSKSWLPRVIVVSSLSFSIHLLWLVDDIGFGIFFLLKSTRYLNCVIDSTEEWWNVTNSTGLVDVGHFRPCFTLSVLVLSTKVDKRLDHLFYKVKRV